MLLELKISNFALIEEQSIAFGAGLNVISGETGSGKSIVLQALELVLGARPKTQYLRAGAKEWRVEALFDLSATAPKIRAQFPEFLEGNELAVLRTMNAEGRGKVYLNGRVATLAMLEETVGRLINICRQGHQGRLIDPRYHLELIDEFSGNQELLAEYGSRYQSWSALAVQLAEFEERAARAARRQSELEFLIEELSAVKPRAGLRDELEQKLKGLANSEAVQEKAAQLISSFEEEGGILACLSQVEHAGHDLARIAPQAAELAERLGTLSAEAEALTDEIKRRFERVELNPEEIEALREELAELARLERKYRTDSAGLAAMLAESSEELATIQDPGSHAELQARVSENEKMVRAAAAKLRAARSAGAARLVKQVERELAELNMKEAKLRIDFTEAEPGPYGMDQVNFLAAPNKGEGFKALAQIASGGELSRLMLVMKKILRDRSGVNVLVFDEVDSGVSGAVARSVGEKLKGLASDSQVICITHLAQVASMADHHLVVEKQVGKRTVSLIREIQGDEKIDEIARMLAGYTLTKASRESAKELLSSKD
ncbi:MAG: DNA repair protein RecN [Oligoflexia bacterium]|nr:DNA repair protein RecN [Oligoflexia bacterium]